MNSQKVPDARSLESVGSKFEIKVPNKRPSLRRMFVRILSSDSRACQEPEGSTIYAR